MQSSPIQKILVPLDLSPFSDAATTVACSIARSHQAMVEGVVILDLPEIAGLDIPYHAWMMPEALKISEQRSADAKERIADASARFAAACQSRNVTHLEAEYQGVPAERILEAAAFHDLVVMGLRTYFHFETSDGAGDSLERVLQAPTAPVIAVPKRSEGDWKNVLIAFDGSPHATRALKEFARFAHPYEFEITLLMSADDPLRAETVLGQAMAYLRAHGQKSIETLVTKRDVRAIIEEDLIETADLVVAGIHARKHIKNVFVGSLTQRLIDFGHTALFLI